MRKRIREHQTLIGSAVGMVIGSLVTTELSASLVTGLLGLAGGLVVKFWQTRTERLYLRKQLQDFSRRRLLVNLKLRGRPMVVGEVFRVGWVAVEIELPGQSRHEEYYLSEIEWVAPQAPHRALTI